MSDKCFRCVRNNPKTLLPKTRDFISSQVWDTPNKIVSSKQRTGSIYLLIDSVALQQTKAEQLVLTLFWIKLCYIATKMKRLMAIVKLTHRILNNQSTMLILWSIPCSCALDFHYSKQANSTRCQSDLTLKKNPPSNSLKICFILAGLQQHTAIHSIKKTVDGLLT